MRLFFLSLRTVAATTLVLAPLTLELVFFPFCELTFFAVLLAILLTRVRSERVGI